jgi:hypothetical protein
MIIIILIILILIIIIIFQYFVVKKLVDGSPPALRSSTMATVQSFAGRPGHRHRCHGSEAGGTLGEAAGDLERCALAVQKQQTAFFLGGSTIKIKDLMGLTSKQWCFVCGI